MSGRANGVPHSGLRLGCWEGAKGTAGANADLGACNMMHLSMLSLAFLHAQLVSMLMSAGAIQLKLGKLFVVKVNDSICLVIFKP